MVTFEEARATVDHALRPGWPRDGGTFVVLPYGWEDDRAWLVIAGAREALVDGDDSFSVMDAPALLVDKATGQLERLPVVANADRLDAMRPAGAVPDHLR